MKSVFWFLFVVVLIFGCSNPIEIENSTDIQGEYRGTFERNNNISNVFLNINNNAFIGEVDGENIQTPRICNGTYVITINNIIFANSCFWTADFDWSLILKGAWQYQIRNNTLTMIKENGDTYILTRQ